MPSMNPNFQPFAKRMQAESLPEIVIRTFARYYQQLAEGQTGLIAEADIQPVEAVPDAEQFPADLVDVGQEALSRTIMLKLNGGLGTSMGVEMAKSLLKVRGEMTFLDIIAHQARHANVPLVLMNSFNTQKDSLEVLAGYPDLQRDIPLDFLQHKVPKVLQQDLTPADWPPEPDLAWAPPGHGDIYTALLTSGLLDRLLQTGYEYAFVSNADNLGASAARVILGYFVQEELPFLMEVADRTPADRKGGHLAQLPGGQLVLREIAQCSPEDLEAFQDIQRHRFFNTNNLWLHLPSVRDQLQANDGFLGLPMIRNAKTLDPRDPTSPPVFQLETAMGAAIAVFPRAGAVRVPRRRFSPVKTTEDLLAVRSDCYVLTEDYRVIPSPERQAEPIEIQLDPRYYKLVDEMESRFPGGVPSLLHCTRLEVVGDVRFGPGVTLAGQVSVVNPTEAQIEVPAGSLIEGRGPDRTD